MKTANDFLKEIENGKPYSYSSPLNAKRIFTITLSDRGNFILSCNNLKKREVLTKKTVINIINNCIEMS